MTSRIERIVRPFETPRAARPQRVFSTYEASTENVELIFGANGGGKMLNGSYTAKITAYMDSTFIETEN